MRYERYRRIEQAVAASDSGGIWERWRYGRRLLCDAEATTPNGNLQHGVLDKLKRGAARSNRKLSDREIQYRLQCARAYPTEAQIRNIIADFETWFALTQAAFPACEAPVDARPYNPMETDELRQQSDRRGARLIERAGYDESLFDHFEKSATLAEIKLWADEQDEITARFAEVGQRRQLMLSDLVKAVHGDLSKTWDEAEQALEDEDNGDGD